LPLMKIKKSSLTYTKKRNYTNPEEKVQVNSFHKLVIEKGYSVENIVQFFCYYGK